MPLAAAVPPTKNHFNRRDGNAAHMEAYLEATMAFRQEVFVGRYGDRQMSLRQMATHPDYWRRGAGHLVVDWGVKKAIEAGIAIVMFASPMGKKLYEKFGFHELGTVYVHSLGDEESLNVSGMAWDEAAVNVVGDVLTTGNVPMDQNILKGQEVEELRLPEPTKRLKEHNPEQTRAWSIRSLCKIWQVASAFSA